MSKIVAVDATPLELPSCEQHDGDRPAHGREGFRGALVAIRSDSGESGYAEAPLPTREYGDAIGVLTHMITRILGDQLIGRDPREAIALRREMDGPGAGNGGLNAKAALDIALHDLLGRERGIPLYELLGGYQATEPMIRTSWRLAAGERTAVLAQAQEAADRGFRAFRVEIGLGRPQDDIRLVRDLHRTLGQETTIYASAHERYGLEVVGQVLSGLADAGAAWVEDPCPVDLPRERRAAIAAASPVPLMGSAGCATARDVLRELSDGVIHTVSIAVSRTGFVGARAILEICRAFGASCMVGSAGEADLGTIAAGHFALSSDGMMEVTELSNFARISDCLLQNGPQLWGDRFDLPIGPGMAVFPDADVLEFAR